QQGCGKAEALLENKWPVKYNSLGHCSFAGSVYGPGVIHALFVGHGSFTVLEDSPHFSLYTSGRQGVRRAPTDSRMVVARWDVDRGCRLGSTLATAMVSRTARSACPHVICHARRYWRD